MANLSLIHFILLSVLSRGLALSINDVLGLSYLRKVIPEEPPLVVEIIRWRQPVCLTPAPGVLPCVVSVNSLQSSQVEEHNSNGYRRDEEHPAEKKEESDDLAKKLTRDDSVLDSSSLESIEEKDSDAERSARSVSTPNLFSPHIVKFVQLENMGSSSLHNPMERISRRRRYLRFGPGMIRTSTKRPTVYVTKVLDSPIVATLVAATCLPDIGIPLCDEINVSHQKPGKYQKPEPTKPTVPHPDYVPAESSTYGNADDHHPANSYAAEIPESDPTVPVYHEKPEHYQKPDYVHTESPSYGNVAHHETTSSYEGGSSYDNGHHQHVPKPDRDIVDKVQAFLNSNRPDVVYTNEPTEVKPVIVIESSPQPGFFDGSWFNPFNQPANDPSKPDAGFPGFQLPQLPEFPKLPEFPQLPPFPEIPTVQEILNKPENDISGSSPIFNIFNLTTKEPGVGPHTESPGIFGGMFPSPAKPTEPDTWTTSTTAPSILDNIGNIFRPTNKPLVIESHHQKPVIVEKPVYVVERPAVPAILNIFNDAKKPLKPHHHNYDHHPSEQPEVIKEPVYILEKPAENQPLFGIGSLPNWNIFGTSSSKPPTTTTAAPITTHYHHTTQKHPSGDYSPPSSVTVVVPSKPHIPSGIPIDVQVTATATASVSTGSSPIPQSPDHVKYGGSGASESSAASSAPDETSPPDSAKSGTYSEAPSTTTTEANSETYGLPNGSYKEIGVDTENGGEKVAATASGEGNHLVEDVPDTSVLSVSEEKQELPDGINDDEIEEQIHNEA